MREPNGLFDRKSRATACLLPALLLALALALAPSGAEAKVSYGPCVDYLLWDWRQDGGAGGVGPLMLKIYAHCDADGDWRAW